MSGEKTTSGHYQGPPEYLKWGQANFPCLSRLQGTASAKAVTAPIPLQANAPAAPRTAPVRKPIVAPKPMLPERRAKNANPTVSPTPALVSQSQPQQSHQSPPTPPPVPQSQPTQSAAVLVYQPGVSRRDDLTAQQRFEVMERHKSEICSNGLLSPERLDMLNTQSQTTRRIVYAASADQGKQCEYALRAFDDLLEASSDPKNGAPPPSGASSNLVPDVLPPRSSTASQLPLGGSANMAPVRPAIPIGEKTTFTSASGRSFEIVVGKDGRVAMSAPPPPVQEITFSGGGGKGAALPGAVQALQESGILKDAKVLNGASVGSMTAALVAAGITAEDFTEMGNDPSTGEKISQGRGAKELLAKGIFGSPLSGQGLEEMMRRKIGASVRKQIENFKKDRELDQETAQTLNRIWSKVQNDIYGDDYPGYVEHPDQGVTFGDLRALSKIIPDIKDLNIAGTYMADDSSGRMENKGKPQLAMFNADTTPDLDIAVAVHASAALPPVFAPVNIRLPSGVTARFEDGGVMNNAPTSDLVGAKRSVDPMPTAGKMTFVFEGEDDVIQQGPDAVPPTRKRVNDFFSAAPNSAAEFAKKRALAQRPGDVVKVPLKFRMPAPNGGQGAPKDFSTLSGGTLNMNMPVDDKLVLQKQTREATEAYLKQREQPETTTFASKGQMLNSVSDDDLAVLVRDGFPGAEEVWEFREEVVDFGVEELEEIAVGAKAADLQIGKLRQVLDGLSQLANGDKDRLDFIGRELNRSGKLDPLMTLAKSEGDQGLDVLKAGVVVQVGLNVQSRVQAVSREVIYPKMMTASMTVPGGGLLLRKVDDVLRTAKTPEQFDEAIDALIGHFGQKSDITGSHGHKDFLAELWKYKYVPPPPDGPPPRAPTPQWELPPRNRDLIEAKLRERAARAAQADANEVPPPPPSSPPVPPRNPELVARVAERARAARAAQADANEVPPPPPSSPPMPPRNPELVARVAERARAARAAQADANEVPPPPPPSEPPPPSDPSPPPPPPQTN